LSPKKFEQGRGIKAQESFPAVVKGYKLVFNLKAIPWDEPVMGNLQKDENYEVHGIVYKISPKQWKHVQLTEGNSRSYQVIETQAETYDKRFLRVFTLKSEINIVEGERPSLRYLSLLREGAKYYHLSEEYQNFLDNSPVNDPSFMSYMIYFVMILLIPFLMISGLCRLLKISEHIGWNIIRYVMNGFWRLRLYSRSSFPLTTPHPKFG